jgi:uncharacterized protein (TIGR02145 family)
MVIASKIYYTTKTLQAWSAMVGYGRLYNWYAVNTGKLCPSGWHVPTDREWGSLIITLGGQNEAGGVLKETGLNGRSDKQHDGRKQ